MGDGDIWEGLYYYLGAGKGDTSDGSIHYLREVEGDVSGGLYHLRCAAPHKEVLDISGPSILSIMNGRLYTKDVSLRT